jgi:hypothetical protein
MEKLNAEGKHQWDYYKAQIDLVEFALWKGYAINTQKTSRNYVVLKKEGDVIVVYQNQNTGYQGFFNPLNTKDNGSVLNFEYNRSNRNWRAVFGALDGFLNELSTGKRIKRKNILRPVAPPEAQFDAEYDFKFESLYDYSYLSQRGIFWDTISAECFRGQVLNKTFMYDGVQYVNTAFPLQNQTGVVAAIVRNTHYNKVERARGDACWVSNLAISDANNVVMVITESPIDALSYHQLFTPASSENRLYVATAGNLSETQPNYIQYLIELYQPQQIILANDNDKAGIFQNVKLMGLLLHPTCSHNLKAAIQLNGQKATFSFRYEAQTPEAYISTLEIKATQYFKTNKKFVAHRSDGWVDVHLEASLTHISELEIFLTQEKQPLNWLKIHRPQTKDFNEDLQLMAKRDPNYSDMSF